MNYYKQPQEWWTADVDGDCFTFNLYSCTENSKILIKRWRGDFRKEEYCQIYEQYFYFKSLTQIEWSSGGKKTMEEPMKQRMKIRNIISITVLKLIQLQNLGLSEHLSIDNPYLKGFQLFILQFIKNKTLKMLI